MKRSTALLLGLCLSLAQAATDELDADARVYVSGLRHAMSLKHKIGQMVQLNIDVLLNHDALTLNTTTYAPRCPSCTAFYAPTNLMCQRVGGFDARDTTRCERDGRGVAFCAANGGDGAHPGRRRQRASDCGFGCTRGHRNPRLLLSGHRGKHDRGVRITPYKHRTLDWACPLVS